jgi:hypothetical protein
LICAWLGEDSDSRATWVLLLVQLPNLYLFWRLHANGVSEKVVASPYWNIVAMVCGVLAAGIFWYLVSALYYWTYPFKTFQRSARTLLFPRWSLFLGGPLKPGDEERDTIEVVQSSDLFNRPMEWLFRWIARLGPGYAEKTDAPLWEAHRLTALGVVGYFYVYLFLLPITAPLPWVAGGRVALAAATLLFALLAAMFLRTSIPKGKKKTRRFRASQAGFLVFMIALTGYEIMFTFFPSNLLPIGFDPPLQFFPVLGSVAVLITFLCLALAGAAFYLDRFSIPVITLLVMLSVVTHLAFGHFHIYGGEHYFRANPRNIATLPTPPELIKARCKGVDPCSLIVVTATGGGMHAAVWSSSVLV